MRKIYHLGNCDTCQRIIKELGITPKKFEMQNIKEEKMTAAQVDQMAKMAGGYEAIFSKIALKYRALGLNKMKLTEKDYRKYILEEYTFLKRPVIIYDDQIFVGNAPKTVAAANAAINGK